MREKVRLLLGEFVDKLGDTRWARTLSALFLFDFLDRLQSSRFPADWSNILEQELSQLNENMAFMEKGFDTTFNGSLQIETDLENIQARTGEMYFDLWKGFSREEYYEQALRLLETRLEKNGVDLGSAENVLDDGCGGGRYSLALKAIGCKVVTGVDVSPSSIAFANKMNPFEEDEVRFVAGSVLDLPFPNESFDFVYSNGVLHHTYDTEKGVEEIFRVLKQDGRCWLYLYGGKDSLFWDIVEVCRVLVGNIPRAYFETVMKAMGYPPGRIFHRMDFFYVPMHRRYWEAEVREMLKNAGFNNFRRLKRGATHDWDEILYENKGIDPYIYGEGEMRFFIQK